MKTSLELFGIECGHGWDSLIQPILEQCQKEKVDIFQIKEKYGTLRIYTGPCSEEIQSAIENAESKSAFICEDCGQPGKLRGYSWYYTSCDAHANEQKYNLLD